MSENAAPTPPPRLRPAGGAADQRPTPRSTPAEPAPAVTRAVPVRAVVLLGLVVLLLLAMFRPMGVTAVVGLPLALALPGSVLQPRFLPQLHTDVVTRWCLRCAVSLAFWALVGLSVGAAAIPVRSVWAVVVGVVLLAAVVVGEPERERRFGRVSARQGLIGVVVVVVAIALLLAGRGLVAVGGSPGTPSGSPAGVVMAFADPTVPVSLAATGARASAEIVLTNPGTDDVHLTVGGRVGLALPWPDLETDLPAGATRTVTVSGPVPVCSDPQQLVVTLVGGTAVPSLATVVPGAAGGIGCGAG